MIYQVGKKQCSNSGRKWNDIDPQESDFKVQPPSPLEFPGLLTPPPPWNFQFPPWWGSGYFLEPHIVSFWSQSNLLIYNLDCAIKVIQKLQTSLEINKSCWNQRVINILVKVLIRAQNKGRPTDNVRPDRGFDRSNSRLAGHFWMRTFYNIFHIAVT